LIWHLNVTQISYSHRYALYTFSILSFSSDCRCVDDVRLFHFPKYISKIQNHRIRVCSWLLYHPQVFPSTDIQQIQLGYLTLKNLSHMKIASHYIREPGNSTATKLPIRDTRGERERTNLEVRIIFVPKDLETIVMHMESEMNPAQRLLIKRYCQINASRELPSG
jgi:hypothetical protein